MNPRWIAHLRTAFGMTAIAIVVVVLIACTSMGTGTGSVSPGNTSVTFAWTSNDGGNTGTMSATVDGGATFSGPFLQMTSIIRADSLQPLWDGWENSWNDWGYWGPYTDIAFTTRYSGKVVANLRGPDAQQMRCRFHLNVPVSGMGGGGQGECQFTGGRTVGAVFRRS